MEWRFRGPGTTKVKWRDTLITLCSITGSLVGTQTPFTSCIGPVRLPGWAQVPSLPSPSVPGALDTHSVTIQAGEVKEPGLKGRQSVSVLTPLERQDPDSPLGQGPANTASSSRGNKVK